MGHLLVAALGQRGFLSSDSAMRSQDRHKGSATGISLAAEYKNFLEATASGLRGRWCRTRPCGSRGVQLIHCPGFLTVERIVAANSTDLQLPRSLVLGLVHVLLLDPSSKRASGK